MILDDMANKDSDTLNLKFIDQDQPAAHIVSVGALARALEAIQRLTYVLAMRREGRTPGQRVRPSSDIQQRFRLVCELPKAGSYIAPVRVQGAELLADIDRESIMSDLSGIFEAVGNETDAELRSLVPDRAWRRLILESVENIAPHPNQRTDVQILKGEKTIVSAKRAKAFAERLLRSPEPGEQRSALVGSLKEIDFEKNEFVIRHTASSRIVSAHYSSTIEESLLEHPRDDLIVFGVVTLSTDGYVQSISNVDHIVELDRSPLFVEIIKIDKDTYLHPIDPIEAKVGFDEEDALFTVQIESLTVDGFAESREDLEAVLGEEMAMLWKHYARSDDDDLTDAAKVLKKRLRMLFREVKSAS